MSAAPTSVVRTARRDRTARTARAAHIACSALCALALALSLAACRERSAPPAPAEPGGPTASPAASATASPEPAIEPAIAPPGDSAAAVLAAHPNPPAGFADAVDTIRAMAAANAADGRKPIWVTFTPQWKAFATAFTPALRTYQPDRAESADAVDATLLAAASLLADPDAHVRGAALRVVDLALSQHVMRRHPDRDRYAWVLAEAFARATDVRERLDALGVVANTASRPAGRALIPYITYLASGAATAAPDAEISINEQLIALRALNDCPRAICHLDAERVHRWIDTARDPRIRSALMAIAGTVGITDLTQWCAAHVAAGPLARGCRAGLSRLGTPQAFELLYAYLDARKDAPASTRPGDYSFRAQMAYLAPYADKPYAQDRFLALLDAVLGQAQRDGRATAAIARQLAWSPDRRRAKAIADRHLAVYQAQWGADPAPHQRAALDALRQVAAELARPPPQPLRRPPPQPPR